MTANELLKYQLEDVSFQLEKIMEGVNESDVDFKIAPTAMSIREQVEHLCEVYTAVEEESRGVEHAWGEFNIEDKSWSNLTSMFSSLRSKAIEVVSGAEDEKTLIGASGFMVGHEYYHIGQLATLRIATDSGWDPYSIYRHG
jgi:hypothetical protein